jgi:hypothetical protein
LFYHDEKTPETISNVQAMVNMNIHGRNGTGILNPFGATLAAARPVVDRGSANLENEGLSFMLYS